MGRLEYVISHIFTVFLVWSIWGIFINLLYIKTKTTTLIKNVWSTLGSTAVMPMIVVAWPAVTEVVVLGVSAIASFRRGNSPRRDLW